MKNTLNGINNRLDNAEEKTTESEASQQKPSKKIKKKKYHTSEMLDNFK